MRKKNTYEKTWKDIINRDRGKQNKAVTSLRQIQSGSRKYLNPLYEEQSHPGIYENRIQNTTRMNSKGFFSKNSSQHMLQTFKRHKKNKTLYLNPIPEYNFQHQGFGKTDGKYPSNFRGKVRTNSYNEGNLTGLLSILKNRKEKNKAISHQTQLKKENFEFIKKLGVGKYGTVYMVRHKFTSFLMAMKIINKHKIIQNQILEQLVREIKIQCYLQHPNIIKLYGFFDDPDNFYIMLQLGCDGHIFSFIEKSITLSQESVSYITKNLLEAVKYMHSKKILHRDLKPQNIVLILGNLKLCDFGWAVYNSGQLRSTFCGTPLYFSPELLKGQQYNQKVDIWAIGVLAFELLLSRSPFNLSCAKDLHKIVTHEVKFPSHCLISCEFKDFICSILHKDPGKRLTANQLLLTSFIKKYQDVETCEQLCT